ncbi:TetR family transcriptional regulator [Pseudomonas sp. ICMP 561]|uniref:TetR family transcriptional regulator n=1 Tax=Pseudomonas sp. ICMP 561 TaxID=1718918 RepID=UPI000C082A54|nr:hypothetical protein AO242_21030 [Pseudomonas sp. ICMP 561]
MARKPKEITDQAYTLLPDAAEVVFSRKGYSETTIHDVAQYAGVTRGAVYWHFQDKYALLQAVLGRTQLPNYRGIACL